MTARQWVQFVCVLACLFILSGCQDNTDADSREASLMGVEVVTSQAASWTPDNAWHLQAVPIVTIGNERVDALRFNRIRRVFTLSTGDILVVNGGPPPEMRIFDSNGVLSRVWGGSGGGPGEFRLLINAWQVAPDTLIALDYGLARMTRFDLEGHVLGTISATRIVTGQYLVNGRFQDGQWLLVQNLRTEMTDDGRLFREVARATKDGSEIESIRMFEEGTLVQGREGWVAPAFYPGSGLYVAHGDKLYQAYPDNFEIDVFQSDGTPVKRIRRMNVPRKPTSKYWSSLLRRALAEAAGSNFRRPGLEKALAAGRVDLLPAFGDEMLVDSRDFLWVRNFAVPADKSVAWSVFDAEGTYLGDVQMPKALHPTEIRQNRILGIWRDSLDVETVRVYNLIRHE